LLIDLVRKVVDIELLARSAMVCPNFRLSSQLSFELSRQERLLCVKCRSSIINYNGID